MADQFLVNVLPNGDFSWVRVAGARANRGSAKAFATAAAGHDVIAIVPGSDCLLVRGDVPSNSESVIEKAVPYVLEDRLLDDPEDLVFVHAATGVASVRDVAVVSRTVLDTVVAAVEVSGLRVDAAVPETLLVPLADTGWSILLRDGLAIVRSGQSSGFAIEVDTLQSLLELEPDSLPQTASIYTTATESAVLTLPAEISVRHVGITDPMVLLASAVKPDKILNFMRSRPRPANTRRARFVALSAALVLIVLLAYGGAGRVELARIEARIAAERAAQMETFRSSFPGVRRVVDVMTQAEQALTRLRGTRRAGLSFLDAIYLVGAPAARGNTSGIELDRLAYRDYILDVQVHGMSAGDVESYRNLLITEQLSAELISAASGGDYVIGQLRVAKIQP